MKTFLEFYVEMVVRLLLLLLLLWLEHVFWSPIPASLLTNSVILGKLFNPSKFHFPHFQKNFL